MVDISPPSSDQGRPARPLLRAGVIVLTLLVISVGWLFFFDGPPPDDTSILPRWSDRGGDANPLAVFCREINASDIREKVDKLDEAVRKREKGTEAKIRELIQGQAKLLAEFDKLMVTDARSWQWPGDESASDVASAHNDVPPFAQFSQFLRMNIHLLSVEGAPVEAAVLALKGARLGRGLQQAEGLLIEILTGIATHRLMEDGLKQALTVPGVPASLIRSSQDLLVPCEGPSLRDYQFAVQAEYLRLKNFLEVADGQAVLGLAGVSYKNPEVLGFLFGILYKRNRSMTMAFELPEPVVRGLDKGWSEALAAGRLADKRILEFTAKKGRPLQWMDSNYSGKLINSMAWSSQTRMVERAVATVLLHRQTELMLSIRLFELENQRLPERLEELVPNFVRTLPHDDLGGRAMSWNSKSRVLYSVGSDGKDDGGQVNDERPLKGTDLGMTYWWSTPAASPVAPKKS